MHFLSNELVLAELILNTVALDVRSQLKHFSPFLQLFDIGDSRLAPFSASVCRQFVFGIDEGVFTAFCPKNLKALLTNLDELDEPPKMFWYKGLEGRTVFKLVACLLVQVIIILTLIIPQNETLKAAGNALCGNCTSSVSNQHTTPKIMIDHAVFAQNLCSSFVCICYGCQHGEIWSKMMGRGARGEGRGASDRNGVRGLCQLLTIGSELCQFLCDAAVGCMQVES